MDWSKLMMAVFVAVVVTVSRNSPAQEFHSGWTGHCDGCHSAAVFTDGTGFTQPVTSSEICLRCHATATPTDYQVATNPTPPKGVPPAALTPGGDFAYLRMTYYWTDQSGGRSASPGERHGHNIVAPGYGYLADATLFTAPGGSYPSDALACTSCHDPHGNYRVVDDFGTITRTGAPISDSGSYGTSPTPGKAVGTYRLLAGKGYSTKSARHIFTYDPPIAVAPQKYNRAETQFDTRVAYGKGGSEWCANCHEAFLNRASNGSHQHPVNIELGEAIAGVYNQYVKTGDFSGSQSTAFTSLVPFQNGELTNLQQLAALTTSLAGPRPEDKIMCLTCHRAHASAWDSMTRWNTKGSFLTVNGDYPGIDTIASKEYDGKNACGKTRAEYKKAMYDRDAARVANYQRSLCNKCHAKD